MNSNNKENIDIISQLHTTDYRLQINQVAVATEDISLEYTVNLK